MLVAMRDGVDPTAERKARLRASAARSVTIRELSERWMAEHVIPQGKAPNRSDYKELLARHILPALGNLSIAEIDREHIERRHLEMKNTPRPANYSDCHRPDVIGLCRSIRPEN